MNKTRRMLAILLALCLTVGAVPFAAFSATTEEELANRKNSGSSTLVDTTINAVSDYVASAAADTGAPEKPEDGVTAENHPFPQGTGGSNSFRIPALVTLSDGTLVAAADARWNTTYDGGGLDTIVSRRASDGTTWNYTFANYLGDNGNAYDGDGSTCFIDPALAVTKDDTIYMLVDLYPYGVALNGSGNTAPNTTKGFNNAGKLLLSADGTNYNYYLNGDTIYTSGGSAVANYTVDEYFNIFENGTYVSNLFFANSPYKVVRTGFLYLTTSTDKGATWSAPKLLNVKTASEQVCLVGPGRGLVTKSGTIVFPVYSYNGSQEPQKMGFIYSTDGINWSRSSSLSPNNQIGWSSESAVVELKDGTLRFFFRNGTTNLCYVDYKDNAWGTPVVMDGTNGTETIDTNSNCQISAITYSKTIGGKQVILVSCPTGPNGVGSDQSGASYRQNGKIFAFTVGEDANKSLTLVGTPIAVPSVNSTNSFMYSCLTEQKDGTVSILYEDNENDWGTADTDNDGKEAYYQMSYAEYNIATAMGLTFDEVTEPGSTITITNATTSAQVTFAPPATTEDNIVWTLNVAPDQTVSGLTGSYKAYNVTITNNKGGSYTGSAQVTLPIGDLKTTGAYPFIVEKDGTTVTRIKSYTISDGKITFTAPHFSVMGIAVDANVTNTVDVALKVGQTAEYTDNTGNFANAATNVSPDAFVATMALTGTAVEVAKGQLLSDSSKIVSLANCVYTFTKSGDYYVVNSVLTPELYLNQFSTTDNNVPNCVTENIILVTEGTGDMDNMFRLQAQVNSVAGTGAARTLHFHTEATTPYWDRCGSDTSKKCYEYLYRSAAAGEASSAEIPGYVQITSVNEIVSGGQYLIAHKNDAGNYYVLYPGTTKFGCVAQVVENNTADVSSTEITFTGVAEGTTVAVVGSTQYNITVTNRDKVQEVVLQVGETKTYTDDTGNYEDDPNNFAPDAWFVEMEIEGTSGGGTTITPLTSLIQGDANTNTFYIQVSEGVYRTADGGTTTDLTAAEKWYVSNLYSGSLRIRSSSNSYYLAVDYYSGAVSTSKNYSYISQLVLENGMIVSYHNKASVGTPVQVTVDEGDTQTEITFTGVAPGKTVAIVGNTQYNITVTDYEYRYITVDVGRTESDTIVGHQYNSGTVADDSIATLDSVLPSTQGNKTIVEITSAEALKDGQYLIVNTASGDVLTDTKIDVAGNWASKTGLNTTGKLSVDSTELWTITSTGETGKYTVKQSQYLIIAGYYANVSDTSTALTLTHTENGWTIYDIYTKSSGANGTGPDGEVHTAEGYYLHDGVADGYSGGALGADSVSAEGYWKIYKIVDEEHTDVTFRGKTPGQTTAVIGNVKYVITVRDPKEITINYQLNSTTVKTETMEVLASDASATLDQYVLVDNYADIEKPKQDKDGNVVTDANGDPIMEVVGRKIVGQKLYQVENTTLDLRQQPGEDGYHVALVEPAVIAKTETVAVAGSKTLTVTDLEEGQYVTWSVEDGSYVGVSGTAESATLVGHQETPDGETTKVHALVHNADGTVVRAEVWDVTVSGVDNDLNNTNKFIHITANHIEHSTLYYCINGGALQEITPDMLSGPYTNEDNATYYKLTDPLISQQYEQGFQIMFFAAPEDGYALTYLESTNSLSQYYSLVGGASDGVGSPAWPFLSTYDYEKFDSLATKPGGNDSSVFITNDNKTGVQEPVGTRWGLTQGNLTVAQLRVAYATAIEKGCTGMLCFTKNDNGIANGTPETFGGNDLVTDLTIVSEKIATVEKTVAGILPKDGKLANFRPYQEGMVTSTDEIVFFNISLTLERPTAWKNEDDGIAALVYGEEDTILKDELADAYFYDQSLDQTDGLWDGVIDWNNKEVIQYDLSNASEITKAIHASGKAGNYTSLNIADALNAPWAADEITRTLNYTVAYKIKAEDIPKYTITNHVTFDYSFNSDFSVAEDVKAAASTLAKVTVVTSPMEPIIIDFTQPITISNLTNDHLKYAFGDNDENSLEWKDWYVAPTANYGDVSVQKVDTGEKDGDGYTLYEYTVTYTPHIRNGMMKTNDVVQIYGSFVDTDTKQRVTKVINAFAVYPATTIYYEEDYIDWGEDKDYTKHGNWTLGADGTVSGDQHLDYAADTKKESGVDVANKKYNYGYDPVYEGSNEASNGTEATTKTLGATGSFDFTGTGFEIYANCTKDTGYVMVLVKSKSGQIRLYTVNTQVGAGKTPATSGQTGAFYSVPIVSVQGLKHGEYNVRIVKSTDYDKNGQPTTSKQVKIDAVRIFQTMDPASSNQIYTVDGEKDPQFVELRDLVLTGANIAHKDADGEWEYSTAANIVSQVYSDTGSLAAVVWLNNPVNPSYATQNNLQDLLENGPKNELYLWPGQAVTFTLNTGVTAQIGMKTVSGNKVDYTYSNDGVSENCEMNSSTDMFYHNADAGAITITNKSIKDSEGKETNGVLSITLLKYWNATTETLLAEVSETQIAHALLTLRELPAKEAVLHVSAVDYTGEKIGSVRLAKPGAEGEYVVFTREELLAQLPEGYLPLDEVADIRVACGEERTVSARIGKVATLSVEYVRFYKHTEVDLSGKRVPLLGKKTVTATLTKVQTGAGDAVFTAQEIREAAPANAVLHGLSDIRVEYGQTSSISVFDTQSANSRSVPIVKL